MMFSILERYAPMWAPEGAGSEVPPASPSGAAPASAEAPTPDTTPSNTPVDSPQEEDLSFTNLGSVDDLDELPEDFGEPPDVGAATAEPPQPQEGAAAQQPTAQPTEGQPTQEAAPGATPPAGPQEAGASPPAGPLDWVQQLESQREPLIDALAQERFALSEAEADALENNAFEAVPKLLARTYYEAVSTTLAHMQQTVPMIVGQFMQAQQVNAAAEQEFYKEFPAIKDSVGSNPAVVQDIVQFANAFRQSNPQLKPEELRALVGTSIMTKYKLQAPAGNGGRPPTPPKTPSFVPAQAGTSVRPANPAPENPFAGLGMSFDEE